MNLKSVSIIIPNLNGKHYLQKCLPSIIKHSKRVPYNIVIVDNGSTDSSVEWIQKKFPSVTLIQNKHNVGFSAACNQGIWNSDGYYILLLNSDTEFLNDILAIMAEFMNNGENIGLIGPLIMRPDGHIQASIQHFPPIWKFVLQQIGLTQLFKRDKRIYYPYGPFKESDYLDIKKVEWLSGACLMFNRSLFEEIGPLDENMPFGVEDMDYARRAINEGFNNYFIPEAKVIHHKGGSHIVNSYSKLTEFVRKSYKRGIMTYFKKHHSYIGYQIICAFMLIGILFRTLSSYMNNLKVSK